MFVFVVENMCVLNAVKNEVGVLYVWFYMYLLIYELQVDNLQLKFCIYCLVFVNG